MDISQFSAIAEAGLSGTGLNALSGIANLATGTAAQLDASKYQIGSEADEEANKQMLWVFGFILVFILIAVGAAAIALK